MSTIDRIIDVLDAGLQSSGDHGYGYDVGPDTCARCQRNALGDTGDFCTGCREFLLGDTDVDPSVQTREQAVLDWRARNPEPAWLRLRREYDTQSKIDKLIECMGDLYPNAQFNFIVGISDQLDIVCCEPVPYGSFPIAEYFYPEFDSSWRSTDEITSTLNVVSIRPFATFQHRQRQQSTAWYISNENPHVDLLKRTCVAIHRFGNYACDQVAEGARRHA